MGGRSTVVGGHLPSTGGRATVKTLFIVGVSILLTGGVFLLPARADLFDAGVIPCGAAGAPDDCGINPPASDPLTSGAVAVGDGGAVQVQLNGAAPSTTYAVYVGNWANLLAGGGFQPQFFGTGTLCGEEVGTITTDANGNFQGPITTASGDTFVFPSGTSIGQLNFAFNNPACTQTQFTTGVRIP